MKVLIVDDNSDNLDMLNLLLKGSNFEVSTAVNGAEALQELDANDFNMIISDILMPVMDGFQLCRAVKTDEKLRNLIFIFYTATYVDQKDEDLALKLGADRFLRKPLDPEEFIQIINEVIKTVETQKMRVNEPLIKDEEEVFKVYSERLVNKLEQKLIELKTEVAEREKAEEQVRASLEEKERLLSEKKMLLNEIHHRVKNNMQVIASLLKLQLGKSKDPGVIDIVKESMARIYTMATIHESLHQSERLSEIDFNDYLHKLVQMLRSIYATDHGEVSCQIDVPDLKLSIDQANPIGLVLNELIANSLKYAFVNGRSGEISVTVIKQDDEVKLEVMDNGVGFPKNLDWRKADTLGLQLVRDLVEKQLKGAIEMESNKGTKFTIIFNIQPAKKVTS